MIAERNDGGGIMMRETMRKGNDRLYEGQTAVRVCVVAMIG